MLRIVAGFFQKRKKGEVDWEIAKLIIAGVLLLVLAGAVIFLFRGKGGEILDSIREIFHFGKRGNW